MSAHILTDNCEKVFSLCYAVIATARLPQNNVRLHTLSVWLGDLWDPCPPAVSPAQTESLLHHSAVDPHSSGPTPLIRSASFSYRMQMHVSGLPPQHHLYLHHLRGTLHPLHLKLFQFPSHKVKPTCCGKKKPTKKTGRIDCPGRKAKENRVACSVMASDGKIRAKKLDLPEGN